MKFLAIQNCDIEDFGIYGEVVRDRGIDCHLVRSYRGQSLPDPADFDAIMIGGSPISANAVGDHPFLAGVYRFLERALEIRIPCLGICCGAQILARLLGAEVTKAPEKEIGVYRVRLTRAGMEDPLLKGFPKEFPVFHWHGDTFAIPDGARRLVEGRICGNQFFRQGPVAGSQFHLEVRPEGAAAWSEAYATELQAFGKDRPQLVAECRAAQPEMERLAGLLVNNFIRMAAECAESRDSRPGFGEEKAG